MRKHFITGFVILLPVAVTIAVVLFLINFLTQPFVGMVTSFLEHFSIFSNGFLFLNAQQTVHLISRFFILAVLFFVTVLLGMLTRWFFVYSLIRLGEYILHKIPFINTVYKTSKDVIDTIFTSKTGAFKQVVMAPFPSKDVLTVGLVTRENIKAEEGEEPLIAVFVPTTPNPTSGYLVMYKREDLIYLDISVEEAFKYIISCGVISTPLKELKMDLS